jgi:hypothetical protein
MKIKTFVTGALAALMLFSCQSQAQEERTILTPFELQAIASVCRKGSPLSGSTQFGFRGKDLVPKHRHMVCIPPEGENVIEINCNHEQKFCLISKGKISVLQFLQHFILPGKPEPPSIEPSSVEQA